MNKTLIKKYGKTNLIIATIGIIFLIINSVLVSDISLYEIHSNKYIAYSLNFLVGCEGILGKIGSMSKVKVFTDGEWWRIFLHIYLHAGLLHMMFNVFALLVAGKVIEKRIGALSYFLLFHFIAIVDSLILCMIFPNSLSIGASAGIFGMIGIVIILKLKRDTECHELLTKKEWIFLIVFMALSFILGFESFITHLVALVVGMVIGLMFKQTCENPGLQGQR